MPPSRGRTDAGASAALVTPTAAHSSRSISLHPFAGEKDVDRLPGLSFGDVDEDVDPEREGVDEADRLEGGFDGVEVGPGDKEINVNRRPHRRRIDPRHPGRHGMTADDRVGDPPGLERRHRAAESFLYHGDRQFDPVEDVKPERDDARLSRQLAAWARIRFDGLRGGRFGHFPSVAGGANGPLDPE